MVVISGPDATAGSMCTFLKMMGTIVPAMPESTMETIILGLFAAGLKPVEIEDLDGEFEL